MRVANAFISMCFLLMVSTESQAQQQIDNGLWVCDGAVQAGPCQAPDGEPSDGGRGQSGYTDNDYEHAQPEWADRWGAISGDGNGTFGIAEGKASKADAQGAAIDACKSRGGGICVIRLAYYNQCAAVASSMRLSKTYRAPTVEEAKAGALKGCSDEEGAGNCWIYYSGCSLQERIQ